MEVFPRWNSGYYTHSPDVFASFSATSFETLPGRAQILSGLVMTYTLDEQPEPTITRIPANVLEDATDPESTLRSRQPDPRIFLEVFRECRRKALYDAEWAKSYFPNVKVEVVTFTKTLADCVYAAWDILHDLLEVRAQRGPQDGERKVGFHVLEGVNHHVGVILFSFGPCINAYDSPSSGSLGLSGEGARSILQDHLGLDRRLYTS